MSRRTIIVFVFILIFLLGATLVFGAYKYSFLQNQLDSIEKSHVQEISDFQKRVKELEEALAKEEEKNRNILDTLRSEENKNKEFSEIISEITGTVGDLERLSQTDPELLKKYSRVFFLNEHYVPTNLSKIPAKYTLNENKDYHIHNQVLPYLEDLVDDAEENNINLRVTSAYRSFGEQASLKSDYSFTYGEGTANQFSADQGYSEHQLGTTVDFTTEELGTAFEQIGETDAYKWLLDNAYKYGFILSYPEENSYFQFEPWHWRFVGTKLAQRIRDNNTSFYNMNQRDIDQYLIDIFE